MDRYSLSLSLSGRYSVSGVSLPAVSGEILCGAAQRSAGLLSVPQGPARHRRLLVLLATLDSAAAAGLGQVCTVLTDHLSHWIIQSFSKNLEVSALR